MYRASLWAEGSSGPRGTLTRGTHLHPTHTHEVLAPKAGIRGLYNHTLSQPSLHSPACTLQRVMLKPPASIHPSSSISLDAVASPGGIPHSPCFSIDRGISVQTNTDSSSSSYLPS